MPGSMSVTGYRHAYLVDAHCAPLHANIRPCRRAVTIVSTPSLMLWLARGRRRKKSIVFRVLSGRRRFAPASASGFGIDRICGNLSFMDKPACPASQGQMLEAEPSRHNAQHLHAGLAHRTAGQSLAGRRLVGKLRVGHAVLPVCGGSTTLSVTDRCQGRSGDD
jgi:hypothetical protein